MGSGRAGDTAAATAVGGFGTFEASARAVLSHLREAVGLRLWMVTRAVGDDQVALVVDDALDGYDAAPGTVLPWRTSLCAQMVAGAGPRVAPVVDDVPAYADAPNRLLAPVAAYVGVPLLDGHGRLFGSLCAFDPEPQQPGLAAAQPLVELQARLLSTVLALELAHDEQRRRAERASADAATDPLTSLANRRAWDAVLEQEEVRCRRYGSAAAVLVADLDELKPVNDRAGHAAGDALLRRAAGVLRANVRRADLVARLGGDEFGVLAVDTGPSGAEVERARLQQALCDAGVRATLGVASRRPQNGLVAAWREADADMYRRKRALRCGGDQAARAPQASWSA